MWLEKSFDDDDGGGGDLWQLKDGTCMPPMTPLYHFGGDNS